MRHPAPSKYLPSYVPAELKSGQHVPGVTGTFAGIEVGWYKERELPRLLIGRCFLNESTATLDSCLTPGIMVGCGGYPPQELEHACCFKQSCREVRSG